MSSDSNLDEISILISNNNIDDIYASSADNNLNDIKKLYKILKNKNKIEHFLVTQIRDK